VVVGGKIPPEIKIIRNNGDMDAFTGGNNHFNRSSTLIKAWRLRPNGPNQKPGNEQNTSVDGRKFTVLKKHRGQQ
jgi:hypothetical protein